MGVSSTTVGALRVEGHDAVHLRDEGLIELPGPEIFENQPERPKPVVAQPPTEPVPLKPVASPASPSKPAPGAPSAPVPEASGRPGGEAPVDSFGMAAANLMEAGLKFVESFASSAASLTGARDGQIAQTLSGLFTRDDRTNRTVLSLPLPPSVTQDRLTTAISTVLETLARIASAASAPSK